jgi:alanine-alpha-ketoisovalerate/valine-pyruvate aminotransferase
LSAKWKLWTKLALTISIPPVSNSQFIALPLGNPKNKAEEFLKYHQEINKLLNDLAKKIAQCDNKQTDDEFIEEYIQLLKEKIAWSKNVQKLM